MSLQRGPLLRQLVTGPLDLFGDDIQWLVCIKKRDLTRGEMLNSSFDNCHQMFGHLSVHCPTTNNGNSALIAAGGITASWKLAWRQTRIPKLSSPTSAS